MSRNFLISLLSLVAITIKAATVPLYEIKTSNFDFTPQIDALAVVNYAVFQANGLLPFETQNTLYWTNKNELDSSAGFLFDYSHAVAGNIIKSPLNTFVNKGIVDGLEKILISSTNIVNSGVLVSGPVGIVQLKGKELQLQGGGIEAAGYFADASIVDINGVPITTAATANVFFGPYVAGTPTYIPTSTAFGINEFMPSRFPAGLSVNTFGAGNAVGPIGFDQITYSYSRGGWYAGEAQGGGGSAGASGAYRAWAHTNATWIQVVFVRTNLLSGVAYGVDFLDVDPRFPSNGPSRVGVSFQFSENDSVFLSSFTESITLVDDLATRTNYAFKAGPIGTRTPTNYTVLVNNPLLGNVAPTGTSGTTNAIYNSSLISGPQLINRIVTNNYAAYAFNIDPLKLPQGTVSPYLAPSISFPFADPTASTNLPARVEIFGGNVNLAKARIKAGNSIQIQATNLVGGILPQLDAPFINLDIGSTAPTVTVSNWYAQSVERFGGSVKAFSATWTNDYSYSTNILVTTVTNIDFADTNSLLVTLPLSEFLTNNFFGSGIQVTNFFSTNTFLTNVSGANLFVTNLVITNMVTTNAIVTNTLFFHVLVIDPSFNNNLPVRLDNFVLRADDVHVGDNEVVNEAVKFVTPNFTINNSSSLRTLSNLASSNFVGLLNFTNKGSLISNGSIKLGTDRPTPLSNFVNDGSILSDSLEVKSLIISNTGTISPNGYLSLSAPEIDVTGDVASGAASFIYAGNLTLQGFGILESAGDLYIQVTNILDDSSIGQLYANSAITIPFRPTQGDLLHSTVTLAPRAFQEFVLTWPGEDRGPSAAGFVNNLAIGDLEVDGTAFLSSVRISGATGGNAVYVRNLSLFGFAADVASGGLLIDDNITLYVDNVTSNGVAIAVSDLTALTGGRIIQASAPPAPVLNGNNFPTSLNGSSVALKVKFSPTPVPTALLSWNSIANTTNFVEFKNVSSNAQWTGMTNIFSGVATNLTYSDKIGTNNSRFYRVRSSPKVP